MAVSAALTRTALPGAATCFATHNTSLHAIFIFKGQECSPLIQVTEKGNPRYRMGMDESFTG